MSRKQQRWTDDRDIGNRNLQRTATPEQAPDINALAGAVADALQPLLQSLSSTGQGSICSNRGSNSSLSSSISNAGFGGSAAYHGGEIRSSTTGRSEHVVESSPRGEVQRDIRLNQAPFQAASQFQLAANLGGLPEQKRTKFSFEPPSLFESVRRRRLTASSGKQSGSKQSRPEVIKVTTYTRDIFLLPHVYKSDPGKVFIPRGSHRSFLGRAAGLMGKIEINSAMSESDVRKEVCEVFATPMGLTQEDLKHGRYFPFSYLQKAGSGSRSLCIPSVAPSFEWNGKQVATLGKAGTFIYVLAEAVLPGYEALVSLFCIYLHGARIANGISTVLNI